jgi:hypothetical protein
MELENKFYEYVLDMKDKKDLSHYDEWLRKIDDYYSDKPYPSIKKFHRCHSRYPSISSLDFEEALCAFLRGTYRFNFKQYMEKLYGEHKEDELWPIVIE